MIEIKFTNSASNQSEGILALRVIAPALGQQVDVASNKVPTLIYLDDSIRAEQIPNLVHAITDTTNRTTWENQIQLATSTHQLPRHLPTKSVANNEVFEFAKELGTCNLILFTNEESKELNREISRASEFLTNTQIIQPTSVIETIDSLNDHIKNLKQKTIVNLKVEIELPNEDDNLEALDYIPQLTKSGNTHFANLIDLASEEEKAYAFKISSFVARVNFSYEDLVLSRKIIGGQSLTV
jgi:hypothetical protein